MLGLSRLFTDADQEILTAACANAVRQFPDGIRIWGARPLSGADSEWRYINTRRLLILIEQSVQQGTRWAVFEPNDERLWKSLRRDIEALLNMFWREGALMGQGPQDAFFVRCDATTTTQADLDADRLVFEIGVAPVRPAEFFVIRIMQTTAGSGV
ncbi:phage tail sheath family protein [Mameliella sp.]|uniref:phage tail sheath family protein n=1 Tax=Mameliella sp. TaxID=1924940 RepID=UPI003BABA020